MSTSSSSSKACPKCGELIPREAPQGLCPKCLLREVSIVTESGKAAPSKADLPTQEELARAFPHLEILELIGQGGMAFVYKARQPKLDRFVALKILTQSLASDPTFTERFTREGRMLAKLNHPNIVTIHDFGQANGFFYLLMEYVNGVNLRQAMQAGRFTPAQALALVPDVCEALQYAHTQGILHRDIKPENILLDTNGRIKIADFGIAKLLGEPKREDALTGSGAAIGTPHYMAPEQIERPAEVDHRADIYSLGVVLYELLTGELPLGKFPPPSEKTPLNPGVDAVVLRALEKQREKRYQSAHDVKTGVEGLGSGERDWTDDEWVLSCLTCGKTDSLRKAGGIRIGAASIGKRTLIRCSQCNRIRWAAIIKGRDLPQLPMENSFVRRFLVTAGIVLLALLGSFALSVVVYLFVGQRVVPKKDPSVAALPQTKTIQLHNATNRPSAPPMMRFDVGQPRFVYPLGAKPNYFAIDTSVALPPEERFRPTIYYADGRIGGGGVHEITRRVAGEKDSIYIFSWTLPDSVADDELEAAAARFRQLQNGSLTLVEGKPTILFRTTNMLGQEIQICLEYAIETPPPNYPVTASMRVTRTNIQTSYMQKPFSGAVTASFDTTVPSRHVLDCIGLTVDGRFEENTKISNAKSGTYKSFECEWMFPGGFSTNDFLEAARQLAGAVYVLKARERKNVFSVTNESGDVMRGYLELIGPSTKN